MCEAIPGQEQREHENSEVEMTNDNFKLNLESEEASNSHNTSSVDIIPINKKLLCPAWYPDIYLNIAPESSQTISLQNSGLGGVKRKSESDDYGPNDRKTDSRSGPGNFKRSRCSLY